MDAPESQKGSGAQVASYLGLDIINNVCKARDSLYRMTDDFRIPNVSLAKPHPYKVGDSVLLSTIVCEFGKNWSAGDILFGYDDLKVAVGTFRASMVAVASYTRISSALIGNSSRTVPILHLWCRFTALDRIQLGGGKVLVNTCDKASKQTESDKIGHDVLQNFWKMTVTDFDKRKTNKSESVTEESKERFFQCDYEWRRNLNDHKVSVIRSRRR